MFDGDTLALMDQWGPERVVCVSDRRSGMRGVLVLDNTARGLGKGGTRMSPLLTVREVARLARTMTWKWAAVDLFHGGAKAGILGDPQAPNKEEILRAFARALADEVPAQYVFGLDMGLSERDAAIFVDELDSRGVATGLPRALGGTPYDELGVTGFGVAEAADAAAAQCGVQISGARVVVQGFGAVGSFAARRLTELGAVVIGVSNAEGTIADPDGLDIERLLRLRAAHGDAGLRDYGLPVCPVDDALLLECELLIPAARQDVIDADLARALRATMVVEGANLPTTAAAREILHARGIAVVPDFISNAGGIVAAAFSMDARLSPFTVDEARIFTTVSQKVRENAVAVLEDSARTGRAPRESALAMAQGRVREAMMLRGQCRAEAADVWGSQIA